MEVHKNHVLFIPSAQPHEENLDEELMQLANRRSPFRLFCEDIMLLLSNVAYIPNTVLPLRFIHELPGVHQSTVAMTYGYAIMVVLGLLESPLLICSIPALIILPGWMFIILAISASAIIWALAATTWGSLSVESTVQLGNDKNRGEKWMFINGVATSHSQLRKTVDNLSATFKRPVTGIHNRSYGLVGDLIECLIQRSFAYHTQDIRIAEAALIQALKDDTISKVVVIAHSQGGIVISLALDRLYCILPAEVFTKLEIYTFGSAAASFHNPLTKHVPSEPASPTTSRILRKATTDTTMTMTSAADGDARGFSEPEIPNRLIHTIEHYVNGRDLVPRWGVLYHILLSTGSTYSGRVFVHEHASGHLFDEHYLAVMFPLLKLKGILNGDGAMFLNHPVKLEDDESGGKKKWGVWRARTWGRDSDSKAAIEQRVGDVVEEQEREQVSMMEQQDESKDALTVRQLSKLWRYMDGGVG